MHGSRASLAAATGLALVTVAVFYMLAFVACSSVRLTFGFELSWMESGMQAMVDRLAVGQSIYVEPSPSYVPFIYPPLYYVVAYWLGRALPSGDAGAALPLRLLSLASTVATALVVLACLARRGLDRRTGLLLSALLFAFYGRFDFWQDTSRVDSFFVLLLFSAVALLIEGRGSGSAIAAGLVGGLAVLCKQPAVPLLGACAVIATLVTRSVRRPLIMLAAGAPFVAAVLALLGELGNRWFYFYVIDVPAAHAWVPASLGWGALFMLTSMPFFLLWAARGLRTRRHDRLTGATDDGPGPDVDARARRLWALTFAIWTAVIFVLRLKQGTSTNFFLPLVPAGVMVAAGAFAPPAGPASAGSRLREPLLLVQFLVLVYNPLTAIPTARDWAAGFDLVAALRRLPGDVFLPQYPGYLALAGKPPVAHDVAVCDLAELRPDLLAAIDDRLASGRYGAAIPVPVHRYLPAVCRPASLDVRFRHHLDIAPGGDFFARGHGSRLTEIDLYQAGVEPPVSARLSRARR